MFISGSAATALVLFASVYISGYIGYNANRSRLDNFFETESHFLDKDVVEWISLSEIRVPVVDESFDMYIDLHETYFTRKRVTYGYSKTWVINLLSRVGRDTVRHSIILPVYRRDTLSSGDYLDHFGDTVRVQDSKLVELLTAVDMKTVQSSYPKPVKCEIVYDWGYTGIFDHNRGLAYVITEAEYTLKTKWFAFKR